MAMDHVVERKGDGLMPGSLLMLPSGSLAPAGYTFVGTFNLDPADTNKKTAVVRVDVYRHN